MVGSTGNNPGGRRNKSGEGPGSGTSGAELSGRPEQGPEALNNSDEAASERRSGGWREIEARREKAALKASLADVWDEDFDLDDEILAELDHTAEFFTTQPDSEDDAIFDEDGESDDYFDEEDEV